MRLSAGGACPGPFSSSPARMKLSIGFFGQDFSLTSGGARSLGGCSDQNFFASAASTVVFKGDVLSRGSGAPIFAQATKSATAAGARVFFGGIRRSSSVERMALINRL